MKRRSAVGGQVLAALTGVLLLAGCSQIKAISPVGSQVTLVRFAAIDVLVAQHVDILTAPACSTSGTDIHCVGMTVRDEMITVSSTSDNSANMEISVAGAKIFSGPFQDVLDANARPSS